MEDVDMLIEVCFLCENGLKDQSEIEDVFYLVKEIKDNQLRREALMAIIRTIAFRMKV
jgi:hypothetical protein